MKCPHCSAVLQRGEWFCPDCRRSLPTPPTAPPKTSRAAWYGAVGLMVALAVGGGAAVALRGTPAERPPSAAAPKTLVPEEMPLVRITPGPGAPTSAELPKVAVTPAPAPVESVPAEADTAKALPAETPRTAVGDALGAISVAVEPPVRTFIYLNGGKLLGEAPLFNALVPAGRQRLVFWAPSAGGRSTRTIDVMPGENTTVVERLKVQAGFAETTVR
jgi:hypothetical protein